MKLWLSVNLQTLTTKRVQKRSKENSTISQENPKLITNWRITLEPTKQKWELFRNFNLQLIKHSKTNWPYFGWSHNHTNKEIEACSLGLWIDDFQTYKTHIDKVAKEGDKRINLFPILSNKNWGTDRHSIHDLSTITLFCSWIRQSNHFNGYFSVLKRFEKNQYKSLIICLGFKKRISGSALEVEANILPLFLAQKCSSDKPCFSKFEKQTIWSQQFHLLHSQADPKCGKMKPAPQN